MRPLMLSSMINLAITVLNAAISLHRNTACFQCVGNPCTIVSVLSEFHSPHLPLLSEGILLTGWMLSENEMAKFWSRA
jgi:hypothetical protein